MVALLSASGVSSTWEKNIDARLKYQRDEECVCRVPDVIPKCFDGTAIMPIIMHTPG